MNDQTFPKKQEREMALLGLAATDTPMVMSCPSDETLARFIEGTLTGQGRERLLAHLNRCASCYHHWLEVASLLNGSERAALSPARSGSPTPAWQSLLPWLSGWKLIVPVAATAAFVYTVILWFHASFQFWLQQTNTQVQSAHPSASDRAALLQQHLRDLQDKLGFFEFGVRLSHFDYCDDGVYFFQEFQKVFPGREVLNNLGYCYLQMARQGMEAARAYFYWLPLILDGETRAQALVRDAAARAASPREGARGVHIALFVHRQGMAPD